MGDNLGKARYKMSKVLRLCFSFDFNLDLLVSLGIFEDWKEI